MSVYLKKDGSKVLSLSDEELEDLGWEEGTLLELEHDGIGWTIQQSKVSAGKVIGGKPDVEET
jgi:hypothetical protein